MKTSESRSGSDVGVFILTRNEQKNIYRSLEALRESSWDVIVLDSGSTDATPDIVRESGFARLQDYVYRDHCIAYNEITSQLGSAYRYVVILDSDMMISPALRQEIDAMIHVGGFDAVDVEIEMCVDGVPLRFGSLCPPKPFLFATGQAYFENVGHGERLREGVRVQRTKQKLRHDDRKDYADYLQSQARYSRNLIVRKAAGELSGRDRLRVKWPLLVFAVPFVSYVLKGGFLDGKAGAIYALDRLIAEAVMYRQALADGQLGNREGGQ